MAVELDVKMYAEQHLPSFAKFLPTTTTAHQLQRRSLSCPWKAVRGRHQGPCGTSVACAHICFEVVNQPGDARTGAHRLPTSFNAEASAVPERRFEVVSEALAAPVSLVPIRFEVANQPGDARAGAHRRATVSVPSLPGRFHPEQQSQCPPPLAWPADTSGTTQQASPQQASPPYL
ncbi:uncharacterized protein LOC125940821 isoform X2 [Dermacentor silvarum]|uniref:uncharacterized protein LOC125940821 isoform X2 n=1 Tax=Dermacentor silvarum TaxID=543639 RepID=UPI0021011798|nr:uncharacterized protein LOC125940821 isoform X2 [Dermacentor silvarum]